MADTVIGGSTGLGLSGGQVSSSALADWYQLLERLYVILLKIIKLKQSKSRPWRKFELTILISIDFDAFSSPLTP